MSDVTVPSVHPGVVAWMLGDSDESRAPDAAIAGPSLSLGFATRSAAARRVFAAGLGAESWEALEEGLRKPSVPRVLPGHRSWWGALGRLIASQEDTDDGLALAERCFERAAHGLPVQSRSAQDVMAHSDVLWRRGRPDGIGEVLDQARMSTVDRELLRLDVLQARSGVASDAWIGRLNEILYAGDDMLEVEVSRGEGAPFDRLRRRGRAARSVDGPLISVIMTTFRRRRELVHSVQSILDQTWSNLEVIIVDDASGPEYDAILDEVEGLDSRIRVIRRTVNAGTYEARNRALDEARGEFVTFQDDDDWSHPQRLELQHRSFADGSTVTSSLSRSARVSESLTFHYLGKPPTRINASSLMVRTALLRELGGFDRVRKSGDSELIERLRFVVGGQVERDEVLSFVRLGTASLSRSDFGIYWRHPARIEYVESYRWWHARLAGREAARVNPDAGSRSFPAPRRIAMAPRERSRRTSSDWVIVGDFSQHGLLSTAAARVLDTALTRSGPTHIVHVGASSRPRGAVEPIADQVRALIHDGRVRTLCLDDAHDASVLVVADLGDLQWLERERSSIEVSRVVGVAATSPAESGAASPWSTADVSQTLAACFGDVPVTVLPADATVQKGLDPDLVAVASGTVPAFAPGAPLAAVARPRGGAPALGWVADETVPEGVPADDEDSAPVDVRLLDAPARVTTSASEDPAGWMRIDCRETSFARFLQQLDFYVDLSTARLDATRRQRVLEATASSRVVVLHECQRAVLGDVAIYCTPADLVPTVTRVHAAPRAYERVLDRARAWAAQEHPHDAGAAALAAVIDAPDASAPTAIAQG